MNGGVQPVAPKKPRLVFTDIQRRTLQVSLQVIQRQKQLQCLCAVNKIWTAPFLLFAVSRIFAFQISEKTYLNSLHCVDFWTSIFHMNLHTSIIICKEVSVALIPLLFCPYLSKGSLNSIDSHMPRSHSMGGNGGRTRCIILHQTVRYSSQVFWRLQISLAAAVYVNQREETWF